MGSYLAVSLVVLLIAGLPMFIVMMFPCITSLSIFYPHIPPTVLMQRMIGGISPFPLTAVPLFIFAADIMLEGQMAKRLTDFAETLIGHFTGGLAHTTILASLIFGAVSGSTQATVAAIGSNMYPSMLKRGYSKSFTTALIVNASDVSQLIPPSIFLIVYGVVSGTSIATLFAAGIVPGIFLALAFMTYSWYWAKKNNIPKTKRADWAQLKAATIHAAGPLGFVVIIIGGIYSGLFSPTEAAAIAVGYSFVLECFLYRSIKITDLGSLALKSGTTTALVFVLIGGSEAFVWILTIAQIPLQVTQFILGLNPSPLILLVLLNITFFIALMFFNPISAVLVITPLFLPVTKAMGIDPVHLGILITLNAAIGSATPPFGVDLFTACAIFRIPFNIVVKGIFPFIISGILVLILLTIFPGITLFLPRLLGV
ncbi:TRAP transporter large permease [Desulfobacula sp.]|uniref:TRAP transporter large permease n=1 Tax=Desulfobacula sp. TaxID=2593537 RepID=UPI002618B7D5|nr:TRAP transporter large permease [Desulfobacula sp.]